LVPGLFLLLDESRDIVDVVPRIAGFFEHESCGKCAPCREGTARVAELMIKINEGNEVHSMISVY
jgi:NADH:ubiquinone oxidoreductase subunit F (NADH-binding)